MNATEKDTTYKIRHEIRKQGAIGSFNWSPTVEITAKSEELARDAARIGWHSAGYETRGVEVNSEVQQ